MSPTTSAGRPENALGDFLRARRAATSPEASGLAVSGSRRVAGLRREEVAVLADVSVDYYARLEQGRERGPSPQVLGAIARALNLNEHSTAHLHLLAGILPERRMRAHRQVSPVLQQLLDTYAAVPAFVLNPRLDIVASNTVADTLFAPFVERGNLLRMVFVDPSAPHFYRDWARAAEAAVASLRVGLGEMPDDPGILQLAAELGEASAEFGRLWWQQDVRGKTRAAKEFTHPAVGHLSLTYQAFDVRDSPGLQLVVYLAEPGTPSADALVLLATLASYQTSSVERSSGAR
ncbi:MAG: transcriptional regulator [Glaciihabitans sp.]|nr:transcriptional regulator [Glaciihabitans sp.]